VNIVSSQPAGAPFKQFYALAAPVAGLPIFMNSGGAVKDLLTIFIAP
jgi:hypothetical protein